MVLTENPQGDKTVFLYDIGKKDLKLIRIDFTSNKTLNKLLQTDEEMNDHVVLNFTQNGQDTGFAGVFCGKDLKEGNIYSLKSDSFERPAIIVKTNQTGDGFVDAVTEDKDMALKYFYGMKYLLLTHEDITVTVSDTFDKEALEQFLLSIGLGCENGCWCSREKDYKTAIKAYRMAIKLCDSAEAKFLLAVMATEAKGMPFNMPMAVRYLKEASDADYIDAIMGLANIYEHGFIGEEDDLDNAIKLYKKAAALGSIEAQRCLNRLTK